MGKNWGRFKEEMPTHLIGIATGAGVAIAYPLVRLFDSWGLPLWGLLIALLGIVGVVIAIDRATNKVGKPWFRRPPSKTR